MKNSILLFIVLIMILLAMVTTPMPAKASSWYCNDWFIVLSPTMQKMCYLEWIMDQWDPLDWGDGDADDWGNG